MMQVLVQVYSRKKTKGTAGFPEPIWVSTIKLEIFCGEMGLGNVKYFNGISCYVRNPFKSINQLKSELEKLEGQKIVLQTNFLNQKIKVDEYRETEQMIHPRMYEVKSKLSDLEGQVSPIRDYLNNHIPLLENNLDYYQKSDGKSKNKILSCNLSEKNTFLNKQRCSYLFHEPGQDTSQYQQGFGDGQKRKRGQK